MAIDINSLTIAEVREIVALVGNVSNPQANGEFEIGKNYCIRTVTMIDTGKVVRVTPNAVILVDASWVAETGRFADSLKSCNFVEVEPFPAGREVIVNRAAIIDAVQIDTLPLKQK